MVNRDMFFKIIMGILILITIIGSTVIGNPVWLFAIVIATAIISYIAMIAWCLFAAIIGEPELPEFFVLTVSAVIVIVLLILAVVFTPFGPFLLGPGWWSFPSVILGILFLLQSFRFIDDYQRHRGKTRPYI